MKTNTDVKSDSPPRGSQIGPWRRFFSVGLVWFFILLSLYTLFFVSRLGFFIPAAFGQAAYSFENKRYKLYIVPKQLLRWLYSTLFYEVVFRRPRADKAFASVRNLTFLFITLGATFLTVGTSNGPVLDLDDMSVVTGVVEDYQKLSRRNFCGDYVLILKKDDGTLERYFENSLASLVGRQKNIGKQVILWTQPYSFYASPKCKRYDYIWQIAGGGFEKKYLKWEREKNSYYTRLISGLFLTIGIVLLVCFFLYPNQSNKTLKNYTNKGD